MVPGLDPQTQVRLRDGQGNYALLCGAIFDARAGRRVEKQAIRIEANRIVAVCDPAALPENIERIELNEYTILPGLIDVHVHSEDWHAPLYLAKGITTVRDVGCELESVLDRRARWNAPGSSAPRLIATGPLLDCPGNTWHATTQVVHHPAEARAQVDYLVSRGVDQIKAYAFLDWKCFEAILDQAHQRGKFVVAHLGKQVNARQAIEAGLDELEHLSGVAEALGWERNQEGTSWEFFRLWAGIDLDRAKRLIDLIVEKGIWIAVTRLVWLRLATGGDKRHFSQSQMAYVPAHLQEFWETFSANSPVKRTPKDMPLPSRLDRIQQVAGMALFTTELFRTKAKILIGTDAPFPYLLPGFSYHEEMQALWDCGLSETAALQAATFSAAQALEVDHLLGTIEPGKLADLIMVNGDPTEDINALQKIEAVIRDGRWFDPDDLLAQAVQYAKNAERPKQKRFDSFY